MNILHFANVIGKKRGGGVHEVAFNLWNYQNSLGIDSSLWFPGKIEEVEDLNHDIINHSKIHAFDTFFHPDLGIIKQPDKIFMALGSFDIIHQHGLWLQNSHLTYRAKKKWHKKVIVQPHGYLEPFSLKRSKFKKMIPYWIYEKKNLENSDCLIACSNQELTNLRHLYPGKNIALIPNGLSQSFFEASSSVDFFKNGKYGNRRNLLFLSRIHPTKGLDRLLDVFSEIKDNVGREWNLVIAGMGDEAYFNKLKDKSRQLNLDKRVFYEGPVYDNNKIDILASADLFVLPTFSENFGVVIAEALAKGVPALTTHAAPWQVLHDYNCGFWVQDSAEGIKSGLIKAMSMNKQELKLMGENGKKLVAEKFIWDDIVKQTIELYEWLLNGGETPPFVHKGARLSKNKSIF